MVLGPDCRDRDPDCHEGACCEDPVDCVDGDQDGYGVGPECAGPDCDDTDSNCFEGACCQSTDDWLEIYVLDIWAQALPETEAQLSITFGGSSVSQAGYPVVLVPLRDAGLRGSFGFQPAGEHRHLVVDVEF